MDVQLVTEAAYLLKKASHAVAFTGAGISTPSGIPDFRSPSSGLWNSVDLFEAASIHSFMHNPRAFYDWVYPLIRLTQNAQPNPAHIVLAEWEKASILSAVITQNIDGLHSRAGSQKIYELHGHMREATCMKCGTVSDAKPIIEQFLTDPRIPRCVLCGGVMKPNVILFGEVLPVDQLYGAQAETEQADLMVVVGSSLEIAPASDIPMIALQKGAKLIIINMEPTPLDKLAHVVLHEDAAKALPAIYKALEDAV
jgi:NAD-dependent deacetylase